MSIDREDMLELTRRMTLSRNSIDRVAGAYLDSDGIVDGSFNTNFLNLKTGEREKQLRIAKSILFADTNVRLKEYPLPGTALRPGSFWQLLEGIRQSGLKNDALLETFYEVFGERYQSQEPYGIFVYHGRYDVPVKAGDKEWLEGSEEVYEYLICAICPVDSDYEPGEAVCGFLYPAFRRRSADTRYVNVFQADAAHPHFERIKDILDLNTI